MITSEEYIKALRNEVRQIINMLEDAVMVDSQPQIYMLIGKLSRIQTTIDEIENTEKEWSNENVLL